MSLRTYTLITHPAFVDYIANGLEGVSASNRVDVDHYVDQPKLRSAEEIGDYIAVSREIIWGLIQRPARNYRQFPIRKRSGGERIISAPRTFLKVVQWWINDTILQRETISPHAHGFIKGRSAISNAREHIGSKHVLNVDINDFFPSISEGSVRSVFKSLGYSEIVSVDLAKLTTLGGSLPQGAPTSPSLSNIYFRDIDHVIQHYAALRGLKYTRYADDMTFSSQNRISADAVVDIQSIISRWNLRLNSKKTRFMGPGDKLEVTGLILGRNGVNIDRSYLNSCRGWFHEVSRRPEDHVWQRDRIAGTISLIRSVGGAQSEQALRLGLIALEAVERAGAKR